MRTDVKRYDIACATLYILNTNTGWFTMYSMGELCELWNRGTKLITNLDKINCFVFMEVYNTMCLHLLYTYICYSAL